MACVDGGHLIALFGICIIMIYCFVVFRGDLNGSETLLSAYIGMAGALIGAAVGGIFSGSYSYRGGLKAAERNYELLRNLASEDKKNSMDEHSRQLFAQLRFSYFIIVRSKDWVPISGLIYDPEWHKHLAAISSLDLYQRETVTKWFHEIIMLQNMLVVEYQINGDKISDSPLRFTMMGKPGCIKASYVKEQFAELLPQIGELVHTNFWMKGTSFKIDEN